MPFRRISGNVLVVCLAATGLSSCLVHKRTFTRAGATPAQKLLVADQSSLLDAIRRQYNAIRDFNASVDMVPALGSAEKNQITEYKDIRAYILFRKPDQIRLIGLVPILRNTAFDMVSAGPDFKLYIPSKNLFVTGPDVVIQPSKNKLENLRPQHFIDALMVKPVDTAADKVLMVNLTDESNAYYIILCVREDSSGNLQLSRSIWFNRLDLQIARQLIFNPDGNILTDARYSQWRPYDNVPFPKHIEINRPRDEYGVVIDVVKMDINKGVSDDKFVLNQPEGTTHKVIGQSPTTPQGPSK